MEIKKNMIKPALLLVIPFSLAFTGCTSQITRGILPTKVIPEVIPGKVFIPNQYTTTNVGDVMFTAYEYAKDSTTLKHKVFYVKERANIEVKHKSKRFIFIIDPGHYILENQGDEGSYYKKTPGPIRGNRESYGGLFVPKDSSEATELYWTWKDNPKERGIYLAKLATPIKGVIETRTSTLHDSVGSRLPKATITYAGVANGQIRFVYNQFTDEGYIKPAFTQEVGLDYKPNGIYGYKSARFKVYKADSTHINYEVIKPLDD